MRLARIEISLVELRNFNAREGSSYQVNLSCGGVDVTSATVAAYLPLMWRESFNFNFIIKESTLDSLGGSLRVAVFEIAKGGGPGKFVGESSIRLEGLPPGVSRDIEQELRARGGTGGQVEGQLRVIATYFSDMAEEEGGPKDSDSVVTDDSTVETSTTVEEPSLQTELDRLRAKIAAQDEEIDALHAEIDSLKKSGGLGSGGGSPAIGSIKSLSTSPPTRGSESGMDSSAVQALRKDRELLVQQLREKDSEIDDLNNKYAGERKKVLGKLMEAKEQITALTQERDDYREKWMKSH